MKLLALSEPSSFKETPAKGTPEKSVFLRTQDVQTQGAVDDGSGYSSLDLGVPFL